MLAHFLAASVALAQPAPPRAEWSHLATLDRWIVRLDPSAPRREGSNVRVWISRDWVPGQGDGNYWLSEVEIDCAARLGRVRLTVAHGSDGRELARDSEPVPFDPITPGSLLEMLHQRAC